jgi:hypothetical protein
MDKRQLLIRAGIVVAVILAVLAGWGGVINAGPRAEMKKAMQAERDAQQAAAAERAKDAR